jgi:hypothetical protein
MFSSAMAKKSYKQHGKSEKVLAGCMSGLMRMLDFRRHPKLLSDGRGEHIHFFMQGTKDFSCNIAL